MKVWFEAIFNSTSQNGILPSNKSSNRLCYTEGACQVVIDLKFVRFVQIVIIHLHEILLAQNYTIVNLTRVGFKIFGIPSSINVFGKTSEDSSPNFA